MTFESSEPSTTCIQSLPGFARGLCEYSKYTQTTWTDEGEPFPQQGRKHRTWSPIQREDERWNPRERQTEMHEAELSTCHGGGFRKCKPSNFIYGMYHHACCTRNPHLYVHEPVASLAILLALVSTLSFQLIALQLVVLPHNGSLISHFQRKSGGADQTKSTACRLRSRVSYFIPSSSLIRWLSPTISSFAF